MNRKQGAKVLIKNAATEETQKKQDTLILHLENAGAKVEKQNELSQKTAIIDKKFLWYGNVNFLSTSNFHNSSVEANEKCTIRIFSATVTQEIEVEMIWKGKVLFMRGGCHSTM